MTDNNQYQNYCITLTPLGNFFFGGLKLTEVEKEKDYYIKALYYPQQTVILGMIRLELLLQNGLFPLDKADKDKAVGLIGEASFDPAAGQQAFGVIEALSPVLIRNSQHFFHVLPKDFANPYRPGTDGKSYLNFPQAIAKNFLPNFVADTSKHESLQMLGTNQSPLQPISLADIFDTDEQIGIKKGNRGQTEEEGYYKQVFLRMKKGYAFTFYLRLKKTIDGNPVHFQDNFVYIGGERSAFKMEVRTEPDNKTIGQLFEQSLPHSEGPKILLTGDAFVDPGILSCCDFCVSHSIPFRNFRSYVRTTSKYANLTDRRDNHTPFLGDRYNLLARGTVLYYGDDEDTLKQLTGFLDKPGNQKLGFNYYKIYPSHKEKGKE